MKNIIKVTFEMLQTPSTTWPMCLTVLYLGEAQLVFGDSVTRFDNHSPLKLRSRVAALRGHTDMMADKRGHKDS